jgi:hypothetical protein
MHLPTLSPSLPNEDITAIRLQEIGCDIHSAGIVEMASKRA